MSKLKIGVIISSTRPTRFGDVPAQWILEKANERPEIDAEIVDLRDFDLPLFDEVASNAWVPSQNANAVRWQNKISEFDGFIFVVAEYNRAITGALKNERGLANCPAMRPTLITGQPAPYISATVICNRIWK